MASAASLPSEDSTGASLEGSAGLAGLAGAELDSGAAALDSGIAELEDGAGELGSDSVTLK
ncbi:hypothetical protein [uncultured Fibrobacter sp.]|uniref:hypothetical protein n=1 Tax=uncultured Fibrobacter sp. TaxID=261512 RepID=UPI00345C5DE9